MKKRKRSKRVKIIVAILAIMFLLCLPAVSVCAQGEAETENEDDLMTNVEDLLNNLDTEELEEYLDSLTEEQKAQFGGGVKEKNTNDFQRRFFHRLRISAGGNRRVRVFGIVGAAARFLRDLFDCYFLRIVDAL